jgi:hypothetical protein
MASSLDAGRDTVQNWRQGRYAPRNTIYLELYAIADKRVTELKNLLDELVEQHPGSPLSAGIQEETCYSEAAFPIEKLQPR